MEGGFGSAGVLGPAERQAGLARAMEELSTRLLSGLEAE